MTSSFFSRSAHSSLSNSRDMSPLLPLHRESVPLADVSPRPSISSSRMASPSPPPSFYRDNNATEAVNPSSTLDSRLSLSPSPSRSKAKRIQFAAPPPPIATSTILGPSLDSQLRRGDQTRSTIPQIRHEITGSLNDPLLGLKRREKAIQKDIQLLLDAQSAGLIQGYSGSDGTSDAGSSTPTTRSGQERAKGGIVPVRQPKGKTLGLRGARRALLRCMAELVEVKQEESGILLSEIEQREVLLHKVGRWETRIQETRSQLDAYSDKGHGHGEETTEIADLQTEERALDSEIRDLEDRLAQMRAKKRWLGERINEAVNRREARLSGYRGALREVETEVRAFLQQPPTNVSALMGNDEGLFALPAGRRTLSMAKDWWSREATRLRRRIQEVDVEKGALENGTQLWQESINLVMNFEDGLRQRMKSTQVQDEEVLRTQVAEMEEILTILEETFSIAETKGWNLLICAVGAELEAFREGQGILKAALDMMLDERHARSPEVLLDGGGELNGSTRLPDREESEEDGPNLAELMVDRGDHDKSTC